MNVQAALFLVALVLALAAGSWRALSESEPVAPPPPTITAEAVEFLTASAPHIPDFSHFNVNDENPFVPFQLRKIESEHIRNPRPVALPPEIKPKPPAPERHPEPLVLPPKSVRPRDAVPECVGLVAQRSGAKQRALMVRMLPGAPAAAVGIGEMRDGWRLDAIDGPTARWTSPAGESRTFVIAPAANNSGIAGALELKPTGDAGAIAPNSSAPAPSGSPKTTQDPGVAARQQMEEAVKRALEEAQRGK